MKSNKQRRAEIRAKRLEKIKNHLKTPPPVILAHPEELDALDRTNIVVPEGAVAVNPAALVTLSTFIHVPDYYQDILFHCAQCGAGQIWTAKAQKWWYEIVKGNIETTAKYCRPCRIKQRNQAKKSKNIHFSGLVKKHGLEKAAEMLQLDEADVKRVLEADDTKT